MAKVVGEMKASSSKWVKTKGGLLTKFSWQTGYGIFSVGHSGAEVVRRYIANQEEHHRKKTFQDEYKDLLEQHQLEHDERYLWD